MTAAENVMVGRPSLRRRNVAGASTVDALGGTEQAESATGRWTSSSGVGLRRRGGQRLQGRCPMAP